MEQHFAVIGHPIAHSLSPLMHNAGFRHMQFNAVYSRFEVMPHELEAAIRGMKALGFSGWNVTLPHKEKVISYLDELTPEAQQIEAVNTIKVTDTGKLVGHNTDGWGFIRSLQPFMQLEKGQKAVILGAGGAAKSIAVALAQMGLSVLILNRTPEKAQLMAKKINAVGGNADWGPFEPGSWLEDADLVVQTTSIGLKGERLPFSLKGLCAEAVAADIIFNPWETPFLQEAAGLGCKTINGLGMLLYQGVLAWDFWFNIEAPVAVMENALLEYFGRGKMSLEQD